MMHVARSGNSSGDGLQAPGDYRTGCPEGARIMPEVSWTSDTREGGVFGLVDLFRTTFVFEINSSGTLAVPNKSSDKRSGGERFDVRYVRGVW